MPDDLSGLTPEDIPDDLSELDLGGYPEPPPERLGPSPGPSPGPSSDSSSRPPGSPPGEEPADPSLPDDPRAEGEVAGSFASERGDPADEAGDGAADVRPVPIGGPVDHRSTWVRLVGRFIEIRVATMVRDGGPGVVLRWSARAPLVSTLVLALCVGAVLVVTFGVPPVSPLFLIPVVCGPVYPWLRLESRAQTAWKEQPDA